MTNEIINACKKQMTIDGEVFTYIDIFELKNFGYDRIGELPYSIRILLESAVRQCDGDKITLNHIEALANWHSSETAAEVPFMPSRVLLQDFTGVPAVVDLAAMREAVAEAGLEPSLINPVVPVDLVIDHSVMVDAYGSEEALAYNQKMEFERNGERYRFLKWAGDTFENFRVVPPGTGIIHQVNLEYLASVATVTRKDDVKWLHPDTLVGTDSHTTMINGLGVLGWGVGGIEAEAAMLGQPVYLLKPEVIGVEVSGELKEGVTATDLALTVTQMLRQAQVVGKFVEFFGEGIRRMSLADRATVANMAPEYGATMGYFPVDGETLLYLNQTGRDEKEVARTGSYIQVAGLYADGGSKPAYTRVITLDLNEVKASLAGPKRPQDKLYLGDMAKAFEESCIRSLEEGGFGLSLQALDSRKKGGSEVLGHGSVVLAAITSCTNTSNPSVMLGAGLIAKKAVELGLEVPAHVKTSLTPGSRVVTDYLKNAGLLPYLEDLGFNVAGYGCATCIGNSGPLPETVSKAIDEGDLTVASVLSGNRNFEGRIHPQIKANYLASPMLVVIYALAGTIMKNLHTDPVGYGKEGRAVYLKDLWPDKSTLDEVIQNSVRRENFRLRYTEVESSNAVFNDIEAPTGDLYSWEETSTYIRLPEFFYGIGEPPASLKDIVGAKTLAYLGDSVTTDHISPAGTIASDSPAGRYLAEKGVARYQYNSYGSRRGNHEVMMRGTFANIRIRNRLAKGVEGGMTTLTAQGQALSIYDASVFYRQQGRLLVVLAGKEYGTGSSRDWAAKGTLLLGVKAVIAESYERIHRSNLVGMGVLPLQFTEGDSGDSLGLSGRETMDIIGLTDSIRPGDSLEVRARDERGDEKSFKVTVRLDSETEIDYYRNSGILHTLLRQMIAE